MKVNLPLHTYHLLYVYEQRALGSGPVLLEVDLPHPGEGVINLLPVQVLHVGGDWSILSFMLQCSALVTSAQYEKWVYSVLDLVHPDDVGDGLAILFGQNSIPFEWIEGLDVVGQAGASEYQVVL